MTSYATKPNAQISYEGVAGNEITSADTVFFPKADRLLSTIIASSG